MASDVIQCSPDRIRKLSSEYRNCIKDVVRTSKSGITEAERKISSIPSIYRKYDYVQVAIREIERNISNVNKELLQFQKNADNIPDALKTVSEFYLAEEKDIIKSLNKFAREKVKKLQSNAGKVFCKIMNLNTKKVEELSTQEEYKKYIATWILEDALKVKKEELFIHVMETLRKQLLLAQAHKYYADKSGVYININGTVYKNFVKVPESDLKTVPEAIRTITLEDLYKLKTDPNDPIQVSVEGNTVKMKLYIRFTGDANAHVMDSTGKDTGKTYADLAKEGIINHWGVKFAGSDYDFNKHINGEVKVEIIDMIPGQTYFNRVDQRYLTLNIDAAIPTKKEVDKGNNSDERHVPHNHSGDWSTKDDDFGGIDMFIGDGRSIVDGGKYEYTETQFKAVVAHEIGHSLGLGDAYLPDLPGTAKGSNLISNIEVKEGSSFGSYDGSIMWSNGHAMANDIEMVLEAFETGEQQSYGVTGAEGTSGAIKYK